MRNHILFACMVSVLTVSACTLHDDPIDEGKTGTEVTEITASIPELTFEETTKSVLEQGKTFRWETNDKLGFIPAPGIAHPEDVRQSMFYVHSIGQNGNDATFKGNGWGLIREKRYYAYYPYSAESRCDTVSVSYKGQVQASNGSSAHLGAYDFLHSWTDIPGTGDINFSFRRISCVAKIVVTVPENYRSAKFTKMTLSSGENLFLASGIYNPSREFTISGSNNQAETIIFTSTVKKSSFSLALGSGSGISCDANGQLTLYAMMSPTQWAGKTISLILEGFGGPASNNFALESSIKPSKNQAAGVCYNYSSIIDDPESCTDLGADGTANCYIVCSAGKYRFRANVKGNGVPVGSEGSSLATPACAYLVWETANTTTAPARFSIIKDVEYRDGYVYFEVPDNNTAGNAMIALLNTQAEDSFSANGGKTIWVWHIWRCTSVPSDDNYGSGMVMMDRNLGALSKAQGDALSIGLLYQWGRPVPFLGAASYSTSPAEAVARIANTTNVAMGTSMSIPIWTVNGPFGINDVFGSPMQFMAGIEGNRHWTSSEYRLQLWGSSKTQYDPCPPGYKVPTNFTGFSLDGTASSNGGWIKYQNGTRYWWPIGGMRGLYMNKDLTNTAHDCFYWSSVTGYYSPVSDYVGFGLNFNLSNPYQIFTNQASYIISANSVRCQKIQ